METKLDAFFSVPGHLYEYEGVMLQELAIGRRVLETGTHHGRSAVAMAATAMSVTTVDHYRGDAMIGPPSKQLAEKSIRDSGLANITLVDSTWQDYLEGLPRPLNLLFDMIFYDGDHSQEGAFLGGLFDFPGLIAVHDYKPGEPGMRHVVNAVREYSSLTGRELLHGVGSVVYFEHE